MKFFIALFIVFLPSSLVAQAPIVVETPKELTSSSNKYRVPEKLEHIYQVDFVVKRDTPMIKPVKNDPASYKDDCARGLLKECDGAEILKPWPMLAADNKQRKGFRPIQPPELKTFPITIGIVEKNETPKVVSPKKRRLKK